MDLYSKKLAERLEVPKLYTNIYQDVAEIYNIPFLSIKAATALLKELSFVKKLNRVNGVIHIPNHHLGRYGFFLKVPYIITVHDLIRYFDLKGYGLFIQRLNIRDRFYLSLDYKGIKKANHIIAVSNSTKQDLIKHLGIPSDRISVVYEGIDHRIFKPTDRRLVDFPYILYVGSEHPRKNFIGLLKAFKKLKGDSRFKDLKLLKVGKAGKPKMQFREPTLRAIHELGLSNDVIFTEYVPERDLPAYYSGAVCFVLPSFYEGFGFPPLEAMACGCPVIVSKVASLPEIVGDAAMLVDSNAPEGIAEAIETLMMDRALRGKLISRGFERASYFSWEKTAKETMKVYKNVEYSLSAYVRGRFAEAVPR